jgi:uncharacterized membrane protein
MTTTVFLGKLLGLYLVAISIGVLVDRRRALATLDEMAQSRPWMLFSGMVATAAGLALTLAHDIRSGGALAILITLVGWATLAKGLALLLIPREWIAAGYRYAGFERFFPLWMIAALALGLWMTAIAFGP